VREGVRAGLTCRLRWPDAATRFCSLRSRPLVGLTYKALGSMPVSPTLSYWLRFYTAGPHLTRHARPWSEGGEPLVHYSASMMVSTSQESSRVEGSERTLRKELVQPRTATARSKAAYPPFVVLFRSYRSHGPPDFRAHLGGTVT
jgi:hypothetical protein